MKYLLLSPTGIPITGRTLWTAVFNCAGMSYDASMGRVVTNWAIRDHEYFPPGSTDLQIARRGLELLRAKGYSLYELKED